MERSVGGTGGTGGAANQQGGSGGIGQGPDVHFSGAIHSIQLAQAQADDCALYLPNWQQVTVSDHQIMDFVSPLNFFPRHQEISDNRQRGTGIWFLEHPTFVEWKTGSTRLLWCSGIPGSGKTVLTSLVVDHLNQENPPVGVACAYINYKESTLQTQKHILGAIWRQLAKNHDLQEARVISRKHSKEKTTITLEEIQHLLGSSAQEFSHVYIVLDALDEYASEDLDGLIDILLDIGVNIKLMVTSRTHLAAPQHIISLDLKIHPAHDDIHNYVMARLATSRKLKRFTQDEELKHKILDAMIRKAEGMFLIVKLQMDLLSSVSTKDMLLKTLESLPANLNETYIRTLEHIKLEHSSENIGLSTLLWVAFTKRPLEVYELQAALALPRTNSYVLDNASLVQPEDILEACHGLVIISETEVEQVFRLVHYSTQEFIEEMQAIEFPDAHTRISRVLLTCLQWAAQLKEFPESYYSTKSYPLLSYSQYILAHLKGQAETTLKHEIIETFQKIKKYPSWDIAPWDFQYWPLHDQLTVMWVAIAGNLLDLVASLLQDSTHLQHASNAIVVASRYGLQEMLEVLTKGKVVIKDSDLHFALQQAAEGGYKKTVSFWLARGGKVNNIVEGQTALHAAAWKGHTEIVGMLLQADADLSILSVNNGTPLHAAVRGGNKLETVNLLLATGANPNLIWPWPGGKYGTALHEAAFFGYTELCEALLKANAAVDLIAGNYGTALQAAALGKSLESLKLLLSVGADPNLIVGKYGTALHVAAYWGHNEICKALLEANANVNLVAGDYETALQAAAQENHLQTIELLITAGADPNLGGGDYGTPLSAAAHRGHKQICKALLEANADVNLEAGRYGTALHFAVFGGELDTLKLLLAAGADPNLVGGVDRTPLQEAADRGYTEICKALLAANADVNLVALSCETALQAAVDVRNLEIVKLLLAAGADPNLIGGEFGTALQLAACWRHNAKLCEALLKANADVNIVSGIYGTALHAAVAAKALEVTKLLLAAGADPNLIAGEYGTTLQAAALFGYQGICEALLAAKANVNLIAGKYTTALQAAIQREKLEIVKILLAAGADPNLMGDMSEPPLQVAACRGHLQILKHLIKHNADINLIGGRHGTALRAASLKGHDEIVQVLLAAGADRNLGTDYDESDSDWSDTQSTSSSIYYSCVEGEL
uniref:protein S-acyltransferase n=1 Tax=Mycena chlorophos TaxID=658473 RepID=A0ABQ0KX57_MYCCL|nr:NACHT and ankyrin domain protein [Mycena chlorophos]